MRIALAVLTTIVVLVFLDGVATRTLGAAAGGVPGLVAVGVVYFMAFFIGARIGGPEFFWPGLVLYVAFWVASLALARSIVTGIQDVVGEVSGLSLLDVFMQNLVPIAIAGVACLAALKLGSAASADAEVSDAP